MIITNEEKQANLVQNAYHREMEVYSYQVNIDNYASMLSVLPTDEWPVGLAQYQGADVASLPHSLSDEYISTISDYQYRDRIRSLIRTERIEQAKASRVLEALKAQIGVDYSTLVNAYKATIGV